MSVRSRHAERWVRTCVVLLLAASTGCRRPPDQAADDAALTRLRPLEQPNVEAFSDLVQEQLNDQYSRVEMLAAEPDPDPSRLAEAYGVLGKLLLAYDLNWAAEPALLNAADLQSEDFRWPYYLSHLYQREGEIERAIDHLERTVELNPDYLPARVGLGLVLGDLGRDSEAAAVLREVLDQDPEHAIAHFLLGNLTAAEDPARAIEHYETVLRLQPGAAPVRYPLAIAYRNIGELERSRALLAQAGSSPLSMQDSLFEELEEIRKGSGAVIHQGNLLLRQGRLREAAAAYARAAEADSMSVDAHLNLGAVIAQLGDLEGAKRALQRVLQLDPGNGPAQYYLGLILAQSGGAAEAAKAMEHLRAAVEADPGNVPAHLALGNMLWQQRDCRGAAPHFEQVLALRPQSIEIRVKEAVCRAQLGDYARARNLLEAGYAGSPNEPRLQNALARVLAASPDASVRDGQRAVAIAEQLSANHRGPQVLECLAMAYAEVGRFSEAVRYQKEVIDAAERQGVSAEMLEHLRTNLRRYEQGQPSRSPWASVFTR